MSPHKATVMQIAALIALVQLSFATDVLDDSIKTLTTLQLNRELSKGNDLGDNFVRGSRAADSPLAPKIVVQCSGDFIDVTVQFADVFNGIIYSKGYLNDPKCEYVALGGSQSRYSFRVPLNGCGSMSLCNDDGTIDNVLVFQNDGFVEGPLEFTHKISCVRTDPRCPKFTTLKPAQCNSNSSDPRCLQPTTPVPPRCNPGSIDPACPKLTISGQARCFPGSTDPRCPQPTTPEPPHCFPGNKDPRCPKFTTPEPLRYSTGSRDLRSIKPTTRPKPLKPVCYPGLSDPNCSQSPRPTNLNLSTYLPNETVAVMTPALPRCYPGSTDPRCPKPTSASLERTIKLYKHYSNKNSGS